MAPMTAPWICVWTRPREVCQDSAVPESVVMMLGMEPRASRACLMASGLAKTRLREAPERPKMAMAAAVRSAGDWREPMALAMAEKAAAGDIWRSLSMSRPRVAKVLSVRCPVSEMPESALFIMAMEVEREPAGTPQSWNAWRRTRRLETEVPVSAERCVSSLPRSSEERKVAAKRCAACWSRENPFETSAFAMAMRNAEREPIAPRIPAEKPEESSRTA